MGKKLKNKKVVDAQRKEYYISKDPSGKINKLIFPNTLQVGLNSDLFNSTISGSIHHTRQGVSYLVAGSNIAILSGSNGQVTISATAGASASPNAAFSRSIIPVDTDDTGGALDDGGDLSDTDISEQAFTKIDVNVGATKLTFAGHNETGNPVNNTYKIVSDSITAFTDNSTELTEANSASEGDTTYNITFANSGTRLTLAVSTDSSDAKLKVSTLSEHEDGSSSDFSSVLVNIPIKYTTDAGTSTVTRSFTVQKIKKGTTGSTGSAGDDGSDGTAGSGVVVVLDPMSVTLPSASNGTVSSYSASGATIKVYENGSAINIDTGLSANSRWFVVSANGSSITAGSISQTNGQSSATVADASSISATTASIAHVVSVKNSLGTTVDYTLTQTLTKAIAGAAGSNGDDGAAGTVALAIFGIDSSSGEIAVVPTASSTSALTTPYDTAVIANTNVVSSNSSGELTLAATGTYSVTVSIRIQQEGDAANVYELVLSVDDGAGSYTSLAYLDDATPGADEKTANLLISNAIVVVSSGGTKKLKSEIKKSAANTTYAHVPQSSTQLATIRVEKLS
jgi:hypothetical protein